MSVSNVIWEAQLFERLTFLIRCLLLYLFRPKFIDKVHPHILHNLLQSGITLLMKFCRTTLQFVDYIVPSTKLFLLELYHCEGLTGYFDEFEVFNIVADFVVL